MGFVGDQTTRLNVMLFRTLRGLSPNEDDSDDEDDEHIIIDNDNVALEDEVGAGVTADLALDELDQKDQEVFVEFVRKLDAAFMDWHQLLPKSKTKLRTKMWQLVRSNVSKNDVKRRTLLDNPIAATAQRLPRTRTLRPKREVSGKGFHASVLASYMLQDLSSGDTKNSEMKSDVQPELPKSDVQPELPKKATDIKAGDWQTARRILGTARAGNVVNLTVAQLQAVCKGLGITYSGFNKVRQSYSPT